MLKNATVPFKQAPRLTRKAQMTNPKQVTVPWRLRGCPRFTLVKACVVLKHFFWFYKYNLFGGMLKAVRAKNLLCVLNMPRASFSSYPFCLWPKKETTVKATIPSSKSTPSDSVLYTERTEQYEHLNYMFLSFEIPCAFYPLRQNRLKLHTEK